MLRLTFGGFGHFEWYAKLVNGDQAEAFRRKWIAQHLRDPSRFLVCVTGQFGEYQFPGLRIANVTNLRIKPRFLVDGFQPETAIFAAFDHTQNLLAALSQLFHDVRDVAVATLFGARQYTITNAQGATLAFGFYHPNFG